MFGRRVVVQAVSLRLLSYPPPLEQDTCHGNPKAGADIAHHAEQPLSHTHLFGG